ncbi:hypothetical protein PCK2_000028 [Pneumocystis canis]|nr:hypothetical protein PCK2_000028 [Pneumocystis canis]
MLSPGILLYFIIMMKAISGTLMNSSHSLCTAMNPKTNEYVDLRGLQKTQKDGFNWNVRDDHHHRNFSINICAPLIMNTTSFNDDVDHERVGAMYTDGDQMFSIG